MLDYIHYRRLATILTVTVILFTSTRLVKHYWQPDLPAPEGVTTKQRWLSAFTENNQPHSPAPPEFQETTLILSNGGTIFKLLTSFGVQNIAATQIATALEQHLPSKNLKAGQAFNVHYQKTENGIEITSFVAQPSVATKLVITKTDDTYVCKPTSIQLTQVVHVFEGNVSSSFYSAALKAGVPVKLVQETVDVLSNVVNFQHGIQSGASFKILCNALRDTDGNIVQIQQLKYVSLKTGSIDHKMFAYPENGKIRFFDEKGQSINRALLQTPLNATKLCVTSGFGMRVHPISGYTKRHQGVDFGAPTGTPVLAAGAGKVTACGWHGGYGNRVEITHAGGYRTLYAHLSRIGKGIRHGINVGQRQAIGAVGQTGSATGPHLHFEVILHNKHINPMKVQSLPTFKLTGGGLEKFKKTKLELEQEIVGFMQTRSVSGL